MKGETVQDVIEEARNFYKGSSGDKLANEVKELIDDVLAEYSKILGITEKEVFEAINYDRYSAPNYYQRCNFPKLEDVFVFKDKDEYLNKFPSKKFRCPSCEEISVNPSECSQKKCNWKSYGLFGTLGSGIRIIIKNDFLKSRTVHQIFKPIEMEVINA